MKVYFADKDSLIDAAAALPDGRGIVVASGGYGVDLVDTGGLVRALVEGGGGVTSVALSDDGSLCACGGMDGDAYVWSVGDWKSIAHRKFNEPTKCVGFTSDGKNIVLGQGEPTREVILVDATRLNTISTLVPKGESDARFLAYRSAANLLAVYSGKRGDAAAGGEVRLLNIVSGSARHLATLPSAPACGMALAGTAILVAACYDGHVRIIDCHSGKIVATLMPSGLPSVAAGNSGKFFVTGEGVRVHSPSKLVIRSCKTGNACAELNYPEPMEPLWCDTDRGIILADSLGELVRWELPKDLKCD
ncbi:MAG TPA: WD40 repeat domain-containing protein [Pirellulales bacterium]|nr:WD40 repeat domain-containing protein [Pirellulales bacterium]